MRGGEGDSDGGGGGEGGGGAGEGEGGSGGGDGEGALGGGGSSGGERGGGEGGMQSCGGSPPKGSAICSALALYTKRWKPEVLSERKVPLASKVSSYTRSNSPAGTSLTCHARAQTRLSSRAEDSPSTHPIGTSGGGTPKAHVSISMFQCSHTTSSVSTPGSDSLDFIAAAEAALQQSPKSCARHGERNQKPPMGRVLVASWTSWQCRRAEQRTRRGSCHDPRARRSRSSNHSCARWAGPAPAPEAQACSQSGSRLCPRSRRSRHTFQQRARRACERGARASNRRHGVDYVRVPVHGRSGTRWRF